MTVDAALVFFLFFMRSSVGLDSGSDYGRFSWSSETDGPGNRLYLTKYIERGDIEAGRKAAKVPSMLGDVESYSGFITVNETAHSNLFFWYFPAEKPPQGLNESAPVLVWLQGGPGVSSLFGLFMENGPYSISYDDEQGSPLKLRQYRWTKHAHVIYIDNPTFAGFSFSDRLPFSYDEVASNLYLCLQQFFQLFPELASNDFYLTGESFAGVFVPSLGLEIHRNNPSAKSKINLKGLVIGNGVTTKPWTCRASKDYLAQNGLRNDGICDFSTYDYLELEEAFPDVSVITGFVTQVNIRKRLHVGDAPYRIEDVRHIPGDFDLTGSVEELLNHYRVVYYNGQLDACVPYPETESFTYTLDWNGSSLYRGATRNKWPVDGELAGYHKSGGNLSMVLVRNAGHMVPYYQPKWAYNLTMSIVSNTI